MQVGAAGPAILTAVQAAVAGGGLVAAGILVMGGQAVHIPVEVEVVQEEGPELVVQVVLA